MGDAVVENTCKGALISSFLLSSLELNPTSCSFESIEFNLSRDAEIREGGPPQFSTASSNLTWELNEKLRTHHSSTPIPVYLHDIQAFLSIRDLSEGRYL